MYMYIYNTINTPCVYIYQIRRRIDMFSNIVYTIGKNTFLYTTIMPRLCLNIDLSILLSMTYNSFLNKKKQTKYTKYSQLCIKIPCV